MSITRLLSGISILGIAGVGLYFGLHQKKKEDNYKTKIDGYRKVAKTARDLISKNNDLNNSKLVVMPPDSPNWKKWRAALYKHKLKEIQKAFPESAIEDFEKFRDFCYQKIEERMDDLKEVGDNSLQMYFFGTSLADSKKLFWEHCIPTENEVKQLSNS